MCLIVFAWQAHPDYPLVVAANRDKYLARPPRPRMVGGRTRKLRRPRPRAGGTWMALRAAALRRADQLPRPQPPPRRRPSRGPGARGARGCPPGARHAAGLQASAGNYAAFNLLVGDADRLGVLESTTGGLRMLEPGYYGLSNHLLDSPGPSW